ncbi:MAG: class I SAM-dependent methyltransferase [Planctomycetes bacterium]|nr:class I SAM-dependent methyltransferase [Planctomycetota bacterium]
MKSMQEIFQRWFPGQIHQSTDFHGLIAAHAPPAGKILDFGCGDNSLLSSHEILEREVWGTDFGAHPTLQRPERYRSLETDGTIPFAANTFDVVCSHMVMEHVVEPVRFLGEINRVLKPGGAYIGQSIHARHYVTWIRRGFDILPHRFVQRLVKVLYGREEHDTFPTCYRMNSRRAAARAAKTAGLEWVGWHGYPNQGYFAFSPLLFRAAVAFDWGLDKVLPGFGRIYFTLVLRKSLAAAMQAPLAA